MSVSLDGIWSEPLAYSPSPPPARLGGSNNRVDDDDDEEENMFRPTKRRRSTLFLEGSDDEPQNASRKSPANANHSQPDIDSLFDDLDDPPASIPSKSSKPFDLATLRRNAQARAERQAPSSSLARYAVQSSSPPRDGLDGGSKDDALTSRFADDPGANKKRQVPKLDEERLLGKNGLPALVQACKDFKPKGKGHELSDLNRLFSLYQFWSHKLYPKTQFSDTVNRIEKLCHSKRMHSTLLGWMDEANGTINGKKLAQDEDIDMHSGSDNESGNEQRRKRDEEDVFGPRQANTASSLHGGSSSRASSVVTDPPISRPPSSASDRGGDTSMAEDDDPFDIDALLEEEEEMRRAEAATANTTTAAAPVKTKGGAAGREFTFDEDEDAMWAELDDKMFEDDPVAALPAVSVAASTNPAADRTRTVSNAVSNASSGWEDDDAWDVLDEMEREREQQQAKKPSHADAEGNNNPSEPHTDIVPSEITSLKNDGSTAEERPVAVTPAKSTTTSNDDDWDDMYV